jgi:NAD(P)-dependent dehydrogenase (short-subunit alcohol dehydrogenase family)
LLEESIGDISMSQWTVNDIPDLHGRVAIVTGANSGLGLETTCALAARRIHVVMACRNLEKAHEAENTIRMRVPVLATCDIRSENRWKIVAEVQHCVTRANEQLSISSCLKPLCWLHVSSAEKIEGLISSVTSYFDASQASKAKS